MNHEHPHDHDPAAFHGPEEVARTIRDGEVALGFVASVVDAVGGPAGVRRVVDVGSGPGVATCELARLLPGAEVVALDSSPSMVEAVGERAASLGVADRVSARLAELPDGVDGMADVDLVWASMSMHHVSDEVAALRALRETLSDRGVVAILEFGEHRSMLPPTGDDALTDRMGAGYEQFMAAQQEHWHGDTPSSELGEMIAQAGLTVLTDRFETITHDPPWTPAQRAYVTGSLTRARRQLEEFIDADDLAELERLAHDADRPELPIHVSRRIVIAGR